MILITLFLEFFKIGAMAIGGGLVTIPFLIDLSKKYGWYTLSDLADMIAISEATPGPIGVNMATFVGNQTIGVWGGIWATIGLVLPSVIIMLLVGKWLLNNYENKKLQNILTAMRPAVLAMIGYGGYLILKVSVYDIKSTILFIVTFLVCFVYKKNPIILILFGAVAGVLFKI